MDICHYYSVKITSTYKNAPLLLLELPAPIELAHNARLIVLFNHTIIV